MTFIIVLFIWLIKRCLRVTALRVTGRGTRCLGNATRPAGSYGAPMGGAHQAGPAGGPQAAFHAEGVCLWLSACRPRKPTRGGWPAVPAHPRGLVPLPRVRGRWEILTRVDGLSII